MTTIDERLDRLTERHEALTQTVELMAIEHQRTWEHLQEVWKSSQARFEKLLQIAESPEHRLIRLEGEEG